MAEGFKIADAYVEVEAELDRAQITGSANEAGDEAGRALGDGLVRGADGRLRDSRGRFRRSGEDAGRDLGESMGRSTGRTLGNVLSGHLPTILSNPYVLGAATAAGALLAPALGAGIAGGILGGAGLGVIAGGIALIADDPRIAGAGTKIKDKLLGGLKREATPLIRPVLNALGIFDKALDRIIPKIGTMFDSLAKSGAIEGLATGLVGFVENALPGFMKMIEASGPFLASLGPGLGELGKGIGFFAEQIALAGPDAAVFFGDLLKFLSGQIAMWGTIIRFLSSAYTGMRTFFTSIPGWVTGAASAVRGWWDALWAKGVSVVNWISALPGRIGGFIAGVASAVVSRGAALLGWFQALPGRIGAFLATLPGRARAAFVSLFDMATTAIGYGIGTLIKLWLTLPPRTFSAIMGLVGKVRTVLTNARQAAVSGAQSLISGVISFLIQLPGRAYSAAIGVVSKVRSVFTQARSTAASTASSLVSSVVGTLQALPGRAASALSSFGSRVAGALRGAVGSARSIGADIIRGVISGINSMIGAAVSAAKRAVGNIVSGAKSALGIGSPSKVMAREVGRWMLPGLTRGVESTVPAARTAVADATRSLVPPVPGMAGSAASGSLSGPGGGPNYYFAPGSIVIDASSVRSIADLMRMIDRLQSSARAMRPRAVTVGV
ncbi:MAG TPA: hypothetical protein VFP10_12405 [Candidatus Eisenbacteria bacterium]|nr:hypothetical protein [Candidatus Eisenbacteria bacterium]